MTEQSARITELIQARTEKAHREAVAEVLHRQPTATEWNIAMTSFFMGGCCVADAIIEGHEKFDFISEN